jgi:hypothetical protein
MLQSDWGIENGTQPKSLILARPSNCLLRTHWAVFEVPTTMLYEFLVWAYIRENRWFIHVVPHIRGRFTVCPERRLERGDFLEGLYLTLCANAVLRMATKIEMTCRKKKS